MLCWKVGPARDPRWAVCLPVQLLERLRDLAVGAPALIRSDALGVWLSEVSLVGARPLTGRRGRSASPGAGRRSRCTPRRPPQRQRLSAGLCAQAPTPAAAGARAGSRGSDEPCSRPPRPARPRPARSDRCRYRPPRPERRTVAERPYDPGPPIGRSARVPEATLEERPAAARGPPPARDSRIYVCCGGRAIDALRQRRLRRRDAAVRARLWATRALLAGQRRRRLVLELRCSSSIMRPRPPPGWRLAAGLGTRARPNSERQPGRRN